VKVLDSLAEACESVADVDAAQRYKSEADGLATTFYGPPGEGPSKPPPQPPSPRNVASPPETVASPRDPASSRRFVGVRSPASPPTDAAAAVSETAIREGAASMILRLGLNTGPSEEVEEPLSIRQAERHLHEMVTKTGGAAVMSLSVPSQPTAENTDTAQLSLDPANSLASNLQEDGLPLDNGDRSASSSRSHASSIAITSADHRTVVA